MTLSKPLVPRNNRLGTIGEKAIQSRLANFSNPTKCENDIGIDFYCELLENDSPSIPFYVQAKSKKHFDKSLGVCIPKTTIFYWLQQPHPVFLIVYDDYTKECYWLSIEDIRYDLIRKLFKTSKDTIYIKVGKSSILKQGEDKNKPFIEKIKLSYDSIQLYRGQPQFIGDDYVKKIPSCPRSDIELHQIEGNVRASLYSLIQYYEKTNDLETAYICCEFLAKFDKSHYNHFVWLGKIYKIIGKPGEAMQSFREALSICHSDKKLPVNRKNEIIESIEKEMRSCQPNISTEP